MAARCLLPVLVVVLLAGCGGGSGGGSASGGTSGSGGGSAPPNTPKGVVEAFVGDVDRSDWKAACGLVDPQGQVDLVILLHVNPDAEQDQFGQLKDCAASFMTHAADLRAALRGADPGTTQQKDAAHATVSSPKGNWAALLVAKRWRIAGVPRPN